MTFVVDIVSEDSFYDNLTLGLTKILGNSRGVQDMEMEKRLPCDRMQLATWEQRHCCTLPDDLKQFYLSTDGFKLTYRYQYGDEILPVGNLTINAISELRRLAGLKNAGDPDCPTLLDVEICSQEENDGGPGGAKRQRPNFGVKCKIFEMDPCDGNGKACLVYSDKNDNELDLKREDPKIWLLDRSFDWHFLADTFLQYFRMMLVHQGLPQWQFRFTAMGPTPWAETIMTAVAPHLMQLDTAKVSSPTFDWSDIPNNHIDPSIFKVKVKGSKNKTDGNKSRAT